MALTHTVFWETTTSAGTGGDVTTTSRTYNLNDLVVMLHTMEDNAGAGTLSISNSATAQSWTSIAITNTASNCKVAAWFCIMSATQAMTISVAGSGPAGTPDVAYGVIQHVGQHATTPVPAGNRFSGTGGTDVSQAITPTSSGSALWMIAADWTASNTFAAIANCTLDQTFNGPGQQTSCLIRPTTQPRTDSLSFTIGETDTSGTIAWVAFEVQAAAAAAGVTYPQLERFHRGEFRGEFG